jgi:membrane associated rhomboid family serine protease
VLPLKDNIPTDRPPIVTIALIVANVVVYFFLQHGGILSGPTETSGAWPVATYAAIPCEFTHHGACHVVAGGPSTALTALTAMFMHGSIVHLGGNMLFLWIFGNNVEDSMGRVRFLAFYLLGGVAALALQIATGPGSDVPTLGASGAIAAVLGGYLLLFPRARVLTVIFIVFFFTLVEIPALLVLGFWIVEQVLLAQADVTGTTGGVAYFAHIGGFAFGLLLVRLFAQRVKSVPPRLPVW